MLSALTDEAHLLLLNWALVLALLLASAPPELLIRYPKGHDVDIPDNADWLFALSDLRRTWLTTGDPKLKSWLDGDLSAFDSAQIQKTCYEALVTFAPDTPKAHLYRRLIGADLYMATDNHDITKLQADIARLRLDHGKVVEGCNRLERERNHNRKTAARLRKEIEDWAGEPSDPEVHRRIVQMKSNEAAADTLEEELERQRDILSDIEQVLTTQETNTNALLVTEQTNQLLTKTAELVESVSGTRARLSGSTPIRSDSKLLAEARGRNEVAADRLLGGDRQAEAELDALALEAEARQLMKRGK